MKAIHRQEREQLKTLFKQEHIDQFENRYIILEAFFRIESHITTTELAQILKDNGHSFSTDFVRDTLKLMCRFGFAQKNRFDTGQIWYEHRHLGQHHDHMVCTKCRKIIEFEDEKLERLQAQIASTHGFLMLQHKMEIYGICFDCMNSRIEMMPLVVAKQGERLVISDFTGGTTSRIRLMTLGLRIGDVIEVVTNLGQGQLVIAASGNRYVLGRGLAEKVMVKPPNLVENSSAAQK
jgi:Fur family transcriptional regulator, ferric uptake regulator